MDLISEQTPEPPKKTKTADFSAQCKYCFRNNTIVTYETWGQFHIECESCGEKFDEEIRITER